MVIATALERPVLLVDDTNATRYATRRMLTAHGLKVIEATTGEEALQLAAACDAVVLDVNLPDMDGFEVCRKLREDPATLSVPVLHLSAQHMQDADKVSGLDAGADAYLTHPVGADVLVATINALVRARKAERAQQGLRLQLESVIDSAPVPIGVFDLAGRLMRSNDGFRAYLPGLADAPQALPLFLRDAFIRVVGGEHVLSGTTMLDDETPSPRFVEWRVARVEDDGLVVVLSDRTLEHNFATERERLLSRERSARSEAESAYQAKDAFLALVSHELRNPLNTISMWSAMLRRPDALPLLEQGLATIERSAQLQARLLGDLLDASRASAGKLDIVRTPMDFSAVVRDALASADELAQGRQITFDVELSPEAPMLGDPARLHQVVWNLLSNAIKFSEPGSRVAVQLHGDADGLRLTVSDTGIGFEPEDATSLFERFRQASSARTTKSGGLGLGLAIVRDIVMLHGGEVSGESPGPGRGAAFTVRLPLAEPGRMPASDLGVMASQRVLLVEDDTEARRLMKLTLEEHGAKVREAGSAELAQVLLAAETFDLIVSDVGLPGMDGIELMRRIRAQAGPNQRTPALAVTAYARDLDVASVHAVGFDAHVSKPVDMTGLLGQIASLISR
ncbi:hybrid sensor histidine kinase/response regulator [Lysobacter auxotrophicus]|uniref:histidine kinase n=1 Tax=Lysobacter auxotrophicus TaxID=2992573 RepID=A0ABM8DDA6_9GAMM|nr:response regulator [Lysobacter auxotrophicus]BDU16575.1 response regulator [Lysobacter auxotrophicus]